MKFEITDLIEIIDIMLPRNMDQKNGLNMCLEPLFHVMGPSHGPLASIPHPAPIPDPVEGNMLACSSWYNWDIIVI